MLSKCLKCGKELIGKSRCYSRKYCLGCRPSWNKGKHGLQDYSKQREAAREQMNREYAQGTRNGMEITRAAHQKTRELAKAGLLPAQNLEYRRWKAKLRQERTTKSGRSINEEMMRAHLLGHGLKEREDFIAEMAVDIFNVDFGFPKEKIALEIESGNWHSNPRKKKFDIPKSEILTKMGWTKLVNICPICRWELKR